MPSPSRKRVHSRLREARSKRKKRKKKPTDDESSSESNAVHKSLTDIIGEHDSDDSSDGNTAVVVHGEHDSVNENEVQQVNKKRSIRDIIGDSDSSTDSDSDSDDGKYLEQDIKCTQSSSSSAAKIHIPPKSIEAATAVPKPLSKSQRINRNKIIKKAEVQLEKEQFDAALQSLALQNAVEQELPFHPIPNDRRPKPKPIYA